MSNFNLIWQLAFCLESFVHTKIVCPSGHTMWIYLICSGDLLFSDFVKNLYLSNRKKKITIKEYNYSLTILSHSVGLVVTVYRGIVSGSQICNHVTFHHMVRRVCLQMGRNSSNHDSYQHNYAPYTNDWTAYGQLRSADRTGNHFCRQKFIWQILLLTGKWTTFTFLPRTCFRFRFQNITEPELYLILFSKT